MEVRRRIAFLALALLCGQFTVLGLLQAWQDTVTVDEAVDLTAGLVAVEERDLRMNPEHALLHHVAPAVLPVLIADPVIPHTAAYRSGDWFDFTADVVTANQQNGRLRDVVFWFRVVPLLVGAGTGILLYLLGARLTSRMGGLIAATAWLTTPYVVGLAHLGSLDVSFACALAGLAVVLDRFRERPSDPRLVAVAVVTGLGLLVRHTMIAVVPVVLVLLFVHRRGEVRERLVALALGMLIPLAVVWLGYRTVDPSAIEGPPRDRFEAIVDVAADEGPIERLALAVPMPIEWRAGLAYLIETADERPAYAFGQTWMGSRSWFFPANVLVKVPLTMLALMGVGVVGWWRAPRPDAARAAIALVPLTAAVAGFLLLQPLDLGLRLALPVLALALVASAGVVHLKRRLAVVSLCVVGVAQMVSTIVAHPHSLAWSPPPFGDTYRFVSDSSVDLGQAVHAVRDAHRDSPFVAATLFTPRGLDGLPGVPSVVEVEASALVGRVAVSATSLTTQHADDLRWLWSYCPTEVIADAVLVYRFHDPPSTVVDPGGPRAPCDGAVSVRTP